MDAIGLRRLPRLLIGLVPATCLLLVACEEELAPVITKFELSPTCDVLSEHTRAVLDSNGLPVLDPITQEPMIEVLGTWLDVQYFARATGGNRLDDPTGTSGTLEYDWNFGDGKSVQNRDSGFHRYTEAGNFTVTLTVKDKDGQTASVSRDILVGDIGTSVDVLSVNIESGHSLPSISNPNAGELMTFDISDPNNPVRVHTTPLPRASRDIDVEGGYAYVATGTPGLAIYSLANPAAPAATSTLVVPNPSGTPGADAVQGVDVVGSTAYMAMRNQLIMRADVSNPQLPSVVLGDSVLWQASANIATPNDLLAIGTTVVLVNGFGVVAADFADTDNPALLGVPSLTAGNSQDLALYGNSVLVADASVGLEVFDFSNIVFPVQTGWLGTDGNVTSVAVDGNLGFLADDLGGVHVVDLSGGGNPVILGSVNTPGRAIEIDVDAANDRLYVANTGGVQIIDVSNPASPVLLGRTSTYGQAESIHVAGNYAYVVVTGSLAGWIGDLTGRLDTPCPVSGLVAQYTWSWNFGDGSNPQLHSARPRHLFPSAPNSYDVRLTVVEEQSQVSREATLTVDIPEY